MCSVELVEFVPSLLQRLETSITVQLYLTGIQGQSLPMQWQSKPWRRWNHVLHLCSSCLSSTTTTSCVGSLHCTDWSLLDCRLLWHHHLLLDYKFLYQLTGFLMIPFVYVYLALDCQLHVFLPFSLYLNVFCRYSIVCSLDCQCTHMYSA